MKEFKEQIAVIVSASHTDHRWEAELPALLRSDRVAVLLLLQPQAAPEGSGPAAEGKIVRLVSAGEKNRGKDLKKAFQYILEQCQQITHVVVTDCAVPLSATDVNACIDRIPSAGNQMILGTRNFNRPEVPSKFRLGSRAVSFMLRLCYGLKITDPQTGLRVIPRSFLSQFCTVPGDRLEYETNMLLYLKRWEIGFVEQPIEAVCCEAEGVRLHPFLDVWRVFRVMLKYVLSSLSSTVIDLAFYYLMMRFAGPSLGGAATLVSTVVARAISSFVNFNLNNSAVFGNKGNYRKALVRYYCLCIPQMLVSAGLVTLVNYLLAVSAPALATVVKFVIDTCLFFISYQIQREWVFSEKKKK